MTETMLDDDAWPESGVEGHEPDELADDIATDAATDGLAPWYADAALAPEDDRFLAGKGYRSLAELVAAYRALERYQGKSIALPRANAREEEWGRLWDRLGRPQAPDGYRFEGYDAAEGDDRDWVDWFRRTAHGLGLTQAQAEGLLDAYAARNQEFGATVAERAATEARAGLQALAREWGPDAAANLEQARRAMRALELDETELASMAAALGSDAGLIRLLSRLGPRLGEDVGIGRGRDPLALSAGQARARIEGIYQDSAHPYHDGDHPEHAAAVQEMLRLNEILHGGE